MCLLSTICHQFTIAPISQKHETDIIRMTFKQGENLITSQSIHLHLVSNLVSICLSFGQRFIDPQNFKAPLKI